MIFAIKIYGDTAKFILEKKNWCEENMKTVACGNCGCMNLKKYLDNKSCKTHNFYCLKIQIPRNIINEEVVQISQFSTTHL